LRYSEADSLIKEIELRYNADEVREKGAAGFITFEVYGEVPVTFNITNATESGTVDSQPASLPRPSLKLTKELPKKIQDTYDLDERSLLDINNSGSLNMAFEDDMDEETAKSVENTSMDFYIAESSELRNETGLNKSFNLYAGESKTIRFWNGYNYKIELTGVTDGGEAVLLVRRDGGEYGRESAEVDDTFPVGNRQIRIDEIDADENDRGTVKFSLESSTAPQIYVAGTAQSSNSRYIRQTGETIESLNSTEKLCSIELSESLNYQCSIKKANLTQHKNYVIYSKMFHGENNTLVNRGMFPIKTTEILQIGDTAETEDLWYRLNYLEGIVDSTNKDLRKVKVSSTLKNKNITEYETFEGIGARMELVAESELEGDSSLYGIRRLRDGEISSGVDSTEILADRNLRYMVVQIHPEDYRDEESYPTFIYNISDYSTNKTQVVEKENTYNLGELASTSKVAVNITEYEETVSDSTREITATEYVENRGFNESISTRNLLLNGDGKSITDSDGDSKYIGGVYRVRKRENKTDQDYLDISSGIQPKYILTYVENDNYRKPTFLFEINRTKVDTSGGS
jgi:hypothetical protein